MLAPHVGAEDEIVAHLLLIDDDDTTRDVLRKMLERAGHVVTEARHGREGLRLYQATPVDLVITDIWMPEQEGLETITALRQLNPAVKILAISGGSRLTSLDSLPIAKELGAQGILPKPIRQQTLVETVQALLALP